jgi:hypothetical protein
MTDPPGLAQPRAGKETALNAGEGEGDALPDVWCVVHMACKSIGMSRASPSRVICSVSATTDSLSSSSQTNCTELPLDRKGFTPAGVMITFIVWAWATVWRKDVPKLWAIRWTWSNDIPGET